MKLDESYHYFFDNQGRCPECGKMLIMSFGCVNFNCSIFREHVCNLQTKSEKMAILKACNIYYLFKYEKDKFFTKKLNSKNLDKQPKKQYIKTDDTGISE